MGVSSHGEKYFGSSHFLAWSEKVKGVTVRDSEIGNDKMASG